jgi:hypothetical protein
MSSNNDNPQGEGPKGLPSLGDETSRTSLHSLTTKDYPCHPSITAIDLSSRIGPRGYTPAAADDDFDLLSFLLFVVASTSITHHEIQKIMASRVYPHDDHEMQLDTTQRVERPSLRSAAQAVPSVALPYRGQIQVFSSGMFRYNLTSAYRQTLWDATSHEPSRCLGGTEA